MDLSLLRSFTSGTAETRRLTPPPKIYHSSGVTPQYCSTTTKIINNAPIHASSNKQAIIPKQEEQNLHLWIFVQGSHLLRFVVFGPGAGGVGGEGAG